MQSKRTYDSKAAQQYHEKKKKKYTTTSSKATQTNRLLVWLPTTNHRGRFVPGRAKRWPETHEEVEVEEEEEEEEEGNSSLSAQGLKMSIIQNDQLAIKLGVTGRVSLRSDRHGGDGDRFDCINLMSWETLKVVKGYLLWATWERWNSEAIAAHISQGNWSNPSSKSRVSLHIVEQAI
ncbi:hypothetical protein OPV22_015329 [Ensete ventricosum]|uniref:Uncharacterized protein n=1 Tax=Ensete ventricosum TaxID=4639 RepID=A0AAV8R598_ENSVE|nr:hypothetical protein OPV22_015329 [Ensete ventricosum]